MKLNWLSLVCLGGVLFWAACDRDSLENAPTITVQDAAVLEGNETTTLIFDVNLSEASDETVAFTYSTESGTARGASDFTAVSNQRMTFDPGQTTAQIEVEILGDEAAEGEETFQLLLTNFENAQGTEAKATGTIQNDDDNDPSSGDDEGYTTPESYADHTLVWRDEFDGNSLNMADWTFELGDGCPNLCGWGNNELQSYTSSPDNHKVENGRLTITAREESFNYTSARIITQKKQSFQFGRIDIRARLPKGQGIWPATWMLGESIDAEGWPACGEIDIMELVGGGSKDAEVHGTVHWDNDGNYANFGGMYALNEGIFADKFHVFSIIWNENEIRWLVDDVFYHAIDISPAALSEFRAEHFFIFNVAVGGNWPGAPDESTVFPQEMVVDYIRVFQQN